MDGRTPLVEVRACREEAQTAREGTIYTTGFAGCDGGPPPYERVLCPPVDGPWALQHTGETVSCDTAAGAAHSADCGCGVGLERCLPNDADFYNAYAFDFALLDPLGFDLPFDRARQRSGDWSHVFWSEEAIHFLQSIFAKDRDVRELLTARDSVVNGPLVQFYKHIAPTFGRPSPISFTRPPSMTDLIDAEYDQLADPATLPDLLPHDVTTWAPFPDRGPVAAGLLTMPAYLLKYGSRRGRAHTIYSTFLCRDFIAPPDLRLPASNDPDLTRRPGCSTCHAQLEPLAAYFARTSEFGFQFFSPERFPNFNPMCRNGASLASACLVFGNYDPTFSARGGMQRAAYASAQNADAGPAGLAAAVTADPAYATCMARRVASSFLGRPLGADDQGLVARYASALVVGRYRMRALVRAVVLSAAYREANNLASAAWREGRP